MSRRWSARTPRLTLRAPHACQRRCRHRRRGSAISRRSALRAMIGAHRVLSVPPDHLMLPRFPFRGPCLPHGSAARAPRAVAGLRLARCSKGRTNPRPVRYTPRHHGAHIRGSRSRPRRRLCRMAQRRRRGWRESSFPPAVSTGCRRCAELTRTCTAPNMAYGQITRTCFYGRRYGKPATAVFTRPLATGGSMRPTDGGY